MIQLLCMYACTNSEVEVVKLLLSVPRISIYEENDEGQTALDLLKGQSSYDEEDKDAIRALFQGELLPSSSAAVNKLPLLLTLTLFLSYSHNLSLSLSLSLSALIRSLSSYTSLAFKLFFLCSVREQIHEIPGAVVQGTRR
jgi:hypothetical protein